MPILFPLVMELDLYGLGETEKAVWFGILMAETYKGVFLFLGADAVRIALLLAFPMLSLWLVRLIF